MNLQNKVAIVTGSSRGIGRAIIIALAQKGVNVVINHRNSKAAAEQVEKEASKYGVKTLVVQADVSVQSEVEMLFNTVIEKFGAVDILVNSASKQGSNDFHEKDMVIWQKHFQEDLMPSVMCSQKFFDLNKGSSEKKIVNISSILGIENKSSGGFTAYSAAKSGVNNLTSNLARLGSPSIQVNCIAPGYTLTPFWDSVPADIIQACANETLIKRMIQPEEIAHAVIFLCENDAMTGQIISVDGGV
jgi:3-oxoacyl-[acyl-carrier protein] reductase